jgi:hypothetical protein
VSCSKCCPTLGSSCRDNPPIDPVNAALGSVVWVIRVEVGGGFDSAITSVTVEGFTLGLHGDYCITDKTDMITIPLYFSSEAGKPMLTTHRMQSPACMSSKPLLMFSRVWW